MNAIGKQFIFLITALSFSINVEARDLQWIADNIKPGEWHLLKKPMQAVLPTKKEIGKTTWGHSGPQSVIKTWNGAAFDAENKRMYFHGGGHANYGGNGVYEFDFMTQSWRQLIKPYILPKRTKETPCPQPSEIEHGPRSGHTYDAFIWSKKLNRILYWNVGGYCYRGRTKVKDRYKGIWFFDVTKRAWSYRERVPEWPMKNNRRRKIGRTSTAELPSGDIVIADMTGVYRIDPEDFTIVQKAKGSNWGQFQQLVYSEANDELYLNGWRKFYILDPKTLSIKKRLRRPRDARTSVDAGMAVEDKTGRLVFWEGGKAIVTYDPRTDIWKWSETAGAGPAGIRPWSKWVYLPEYDLFTGVSRHNDGVWFYRLPSDEDMNEMPAISLQKQIDKAKGETIDIAPGVYRAGAIIKKSGVTVNGNGARISGVVKSKGVLLIKGDDVRVENFSISLGQGRWVNDACIRIEGKNSTVYKITCSDTQMGILTGGHSGRLVIDSVSIFHAQV